MIMRTPTAPKQECFSFLEEPWKQVVVAFSELPKEDKAKAFAPIKGLLNKNPEPKREPGAATPGSLN